MDGSEIGHSTTYLVDRMNRNQIIAVILVAVMLIPAGAFFVSGSGGDTDGASSNTYVGAESKGTLVIETSPDFAPFNYTIGQDFVGIELDIARAVCGDMGYDVTFRQNTFDSILLSVPQGKADIGASGFTITDERREQVLFSDPYYEIHQVVVTQIDSDIETLEDVWNSTMTVQNGTTGADYAMQHSTNPTRNVISQSSYSSVILDLLQGKADCEIVDEAVGISQVAGHPDELRVLDILTDSPLEYYGFIFSKSNTALQQEFNESLNKLMDDGTVQSIIDYYERNGFSPDTPSYYSYQGTLIVETSPDFPPFEYMYGKEYAGIDMDLMTAIAEDMRYRLEIRNNNFDSIVLSVQQGKCDIGASGFTMSEDRMEQVLFSDPYYEIHQVVVVKENSNIQTLDDVRGKRLSVQTGTSGAEYAETLSGDIIYQKAYTEVVLDVMTGKADAEIVDSAVAEAQVARNPGLKILDITDAEPEYYGFIFSKDNQELCDMVNESLAKLTQNGTVDAILNYYAENQYEEVPPYFSTTEREEDQDSGGGFWGDLWDRFYNDFLKFDRYSYIFDGLKNTLIITAIALVIGLILGAIMSMVRSVHEFTGKLRIPDAICRVYITVIRGTPMMVQLLLIYYVVFASSDQAVLIASVAFGLNSAAYVAETFRSGINAVPKGQMEACRSLGMNNWKAMRSVILPQALRNVTPAIGNEGISLLKETSIAGYIGVMDLTRGADIIRGQTYDALFPILVAAAIYLAIVLVLSYVIKRVERRLNSAY